MSAEPLPAPNGSAARDRRAEGLSRSVLGRQGLPRPVLSLVAAPSRARRAPFVALVLGILLAGLIGLLLLNTASAQDAFRLHRLEASAANAADTRQALSEQVNNLTGPAGLATQAQHLGMVPMGAPEFWKPGTPLPPGARIVNGMVVVPPAAAGKAAATPAPIGPAPGSAAVTSVPRPGQATKPSTSTRPSTSAKPSTGSRASTGASSKPSTKPIAKATTNSSTTRPSTTKPSATKPSTGTKPAARATTRPSTTSTGTNR